MSKHKLDAAFQKVKDNGEKAFVPYIMAGDGGLDTLKEKIVFLQEAGVTAIELGIPFSDPVADGPTIQEAGMRALEQGTSLRDVLHYIKEIQEDVYVPIVLMTYFNPIYQLGLERFGQKAREAGVSGLIIPDLPFEQSAMIRGTLRKNDLALIQLVSLTSPKERIQKIAEHSEGFLYAVTVNGITGERSAVHDNLETHLAEIQSYAQTPVLAGFGISTPEHVQRIGAMCDGVIVGSKIITLWNEGKQDEILKLVKASKGISVS
ncbi:tryptophan synthase subunit alpha [Salirhabdus sp. Marseille-P4669]|uniref:tryptophan synthase subunit alpha n=1 Tax=Salirhabdus sp. Marseille-P4669 TaxID=2042310 RepID=UPI000C7D8D2A|nr:tryptophan synthase subunit alpha [Salirhabdus sp. Marseille-P4669]